MAKYSDKFVAAAIAMLQVNGYPGNVYALEQTAKYLKLPSRTLRRWAVGENRPGAQQLVKEEKKALADVYSDITYQLLEHASNQDVIDAMSGKDAVMAAAIATDKMRLLQGLPTEIVQMLPGFLELARQINVSASDVINAMYQQMAAIAEEQRQFADVDHEG